jgi:hypothetical protein
MKEAIMREDALARELPQEEPGPSGPLVQHDPDLFRAQFNRRPFFVNHQLVNHPLFALPRLMELARALPADEVEYNAGQIPVNGLEQQTPRTGLSIEETIRRIETCGSWMVLKRVETDPAYRALLDECLDPLAHEAAQCVPGTDRRQGFIFISSPGAVTPFHMDNEYNFLLQVRGSKTVHMWDPEDRFVLPDETIERFHAQFVHRNLPYRDEFETTAWVLSLQPGRGLHFPVNAPHWIQNGPGVSISFSITFDGPAARRRVRLYQANARLRRLGIRPTPIGSSRLRDGLKNAAYSAWLRAKGQLRR